MTLDSFSAITGLLAGWVGALFVLRKDERAVQMEQVTKERTKWREAMRKTTEDIVQAYFDASCGKVAALRARLVTSINPKDDVHDQQILTHFDALFRPTDPQNDIDVFTRRIALLLKHDWERVKWECLPIYAKFPWRLTETQRVDLARQLAWRATDYRDV